MKIYTKTGDQGTTSLYGGDKVAKDSLRIASFGTVDELNAYIGLISVAELPKNISAELQEIQNDLFTLGAELSTPNEKLYLENGKCRLGRLIEEKDITKIEEWIDGHTNQLEPLTNFVLPGGDLSNAHCHIARTICRRAERLVVALHEQQNTRTLPQIYLNRLSDYLFTLARMMSKINGKGEIKWLG